jgi:hypothetical protein
MHLGIKDHFLPMQGIHESLEEAAKREAKRKETPEQAAARLQAESKQAMDSVR